MAVTREIQSFKDYKADSENANYWMSALHGEWITVYNAGNNPLYSGKIVGTRSKRHELSVIENTTYKGDGTPRAVSAKTRDKERVDPDQRFTLHDRDPRFDRESKPAPKTIQVQDLNETHIGRRVRITGIPVIDGVFQGIRTENWFYIGDAVAVVGGAGAGEDKKSTNIFDVRSSGYYASDGTNVTFLEETVDTDAMLDAYLIQRWKELHPKHSVIRMDSTTAEFLKTMIKELTA